MAFTFPENLEQRCNAAGFIWRKDDDSEEKRKELRYICFVWKDLETGWRFGTNTSFQV